MEFNDIWIFLTPKGVGETSVLVCLGGGCKKNLVIIFSFFIIFIISLSFAYFRLASVPFRHKHIAFSKGVYVLCLLQN